MSGAVVGAGSAAGSGAGGGRDWREATVLEARDVADGVRRITLERPAGSGPGRRAAAGTHVDLRVPIDGRDHVRSYSVVESDPSGRRLTLSVLRTQRSRGGSRHLHTVQVGDRLACTQPLQNFPLRLGAARHVLLAGGIGVTALVEAARVLASVGADYEVVYVGRSRSVMAYASELAATHGDRLDLRVDDEGRSLDVEALVRGIADDPRRDQTELSMCGPIRLMDAVRRSWSDAGLPAYNLRFETFGNSGWFEPEPFTVRIPRLGLETVVDEGSTLLEAVTRAGGDLMWDCLKGECGLCQVAVERLDGEIDHRDVFLSQRQREAADTMCVCVSRVRACDGAAGPASVTLDV